MLLEEIGVTACHSFTVEFNPSTIVTPSVVLWQPKFVNNIGSVLRAAACFGIPQVWMAEPRVKLNPKQLKYRHPANFRNQVVKPTQLVVCDEDVLYNIDNKIAVEIVDRAIPLSVFQHPIDAVYIFGPEDGSLPKRILEECIETVQITSNFCLNLAGATYVVLYDRSTKIADQRLR